MSELLTRYAQGERDFRGLQLRFPANLSRANLTNANLEYAYLLYIDLSKAILTSVNLCNSSFDYVNLTGANLTGANLSNVRWGKVDLSHADLTNADLRDAYLLYATFDQTKGLQGLDDKWRIVQKCLNQEANANLSGVDLSGINLEAINLTGANLSGSKLREVKLYMAELNGANLSKADLSGADLFHAYLEEAKLCDANMSGADLRCTNLSRANLSGANLQNALYDESTQFPEGFDPVKAEMILFIYPEEELIAADTSILTVDELSSEPVFEDSAVEHGSSQVVEQDEEEFPEGKIRYCMHRVRERNKELVKKAKDKRRKEVGVLNCDVCGFNFLEIYGDIGADYIECHHTKPVSELKDGDMTKVQDLALVCANCHRMLHRKRPWLSIEQLKQLLKAPADGAER